MGLTTYTAPVPENEYRSDVATLKTATDTNTDETNIPAFEFAVGTAKIGRAKRLIAAAARELDRTANFVSEDKTSRKADNLILLTAVLKPRRKTPTPASVTPEAVPDAPLTPKTAVH